jgi:hypothetical protein
VRVKGIERSYSGWEAEAHSLGLMIDALLSLIGARTLVVYLNADTFCSNAPENVPEHTLRGYQVVAKTAELPRTGGAQPPAR